MTDEVIYINVLENDDKVLEYNEPVQNPKVNISSKSIMPINTSEPVQPNSKTTNDTTYYWRKLYLVIAIAVVVLVIGNFSISGVGVSIFIYGKAAPAVVCPTIPDSVNYSISFQSPSPRNFPIQESVFITYYKGDKIGITLPATSTHVLHRFDVGTTLVTAVATDGSGSFASCKINYNRIPEIICPRPKNSSSTSVVLPMPRINFRVNSYMYIRNGDVVAIISNRRDQRLTGFIPGQTTEVTMSAADTSGNSASCTFNYSVTETEGSVRLVGGNNWNKGRVEIFHDGVWGTICNNFWKTADATLVCRQLRLPYGAVEARSSDIFGQGTGPVWLENVTCAGTEFRLEQCDHNGWGSNKCSHVDNAGAYCTNGPISVRLVGESNNTNEGRIEVLYQGVWGRVADDSWDSSNAIVVCRQLGLPYRAAEAIEGGLFGQGFGKIWFVEVACTGTEEHLGECRHKMPRTSDNSHRKDAGVICTDE